MEMTDRVKALTVVLDADYRIDDIQALVDAIKMMRCVADVETHVTDINDYMNRARVRSDIFREVAKAFEAKK
jgi:enamine deaminase RidA (YjgF/YER057c/UK114 family)